MSVTKKKYLLLNLNIEFKTVFEVKYLIWIKNKDIRQLYDT